MELNPCIKAALLLAVAMFSAYVILNIFDTSFYSDNINSTQQFLTRYMAERKNSQRKQQNESSSSIFVDDSTDSTGTSRTTEAPKASSVKEENTEALLNFAQIWPQQEENNQLPLCPEKPYGLKGNFSVDMRSPSLEEIELEYTELEAGGHWRPKNCLSRNRVAIIIPYRDREEHLHGFLHNAHRVFQRQQLDYAIFVVEQYGHDMTFNKGPLMNAGFLEAMKLYPWQCVVFHDVDTIPENDENIYSCPTDENQAKHLTVSYEGYNPITYEAFIGGATVLTEDQMRRANGFSNDFWGWGGEDDDFYYRVTNVGIKFWRPSEKIGRYQWFKHDRDSGNKPNPCRFELLKYTKEKQKQEGLNSVRYRLKWLSFGKLYTHIMVDVLHTEFMKFQKYLKTLKNC